MTSPQRIDAEKLLAFATAVYAGAGMPEKDARLVADTLVQADLWGHQSHGVLRLGWYLDRIRNGVMAGHTLVAMPSSKLKVEIAKIMKDEGYLEGFEIVAGSVLLVSAGFEEPKIAEINFLII